MSLERLADRITERDPDLDYDLVLYVIRNFWKSMRFFMDRPWKLRDRKISLRSKLTFYHASFVNNKRPTKEEQKYIDRWMKHKRVLKHEHRDPDTGQYYWTYEIIKLDGQESQVKADG